MIIYNHAALIDSIFGIMLITTKQQQQQNSNNSDFYVSFKKKKKKEAKIKVTVRHLKFK